jgi:hypothetical protein
MFWGLPFDLLAVIFAAGISPLLLQTLHGEVSLFVGLLWSAGKRRRQWWRGMEQHWWGRQKDRGRCWADSREVHKYEEDWSDPSNSIGVYFASEGVCSSSLRGLGCSTFLLKCWVWSEWATMSKRGIPRVERMRASSEGVERFGNQQSCWSFCMEVSLFEWHWQARCRLFRVECFQSAIWTRGKSSRGHLVQQMRRKACIVVFCGGLSEYRELWPQGSYLNWCLIFDVY